LEMMARLIARLTIARFRALFAMAFFTARFFTARLTTALFTARFFTARLAAALLTLFRAILVSFLSVAERPECNARQPLLPPHMRTLESSTQA
jgi:hypothetical protein